MPKHWLMVAASTLAGLALAPRWGNSAVDLLYLPAVLAAAVLCRPRARPVVRRWPRRWPIISSSPRRIPPSASTNPNDVVTVVVLFAVAVVTSQLAASVRSQARIAEAHAARNATIAGLARRLLSCTTRREIARTASTELRRGCSTAMPCWWAERRSRACLPARPTASR